jgi:hypothetical protein
VNERRGGSRHIVTAAVAPWLIRWMLLQDRQQRFRPPGEGEKHWIHVVCPEPDCTNEAWVTKYEPETVKQCGQHDGPRIPMVPCVVCKRSPGFHSKPNGMQ